MTEWWLDCNNNNNNNNNNNSNSIRLGLHKVVVMTQFRVVELEPIWVRFRHYISGKVYVKTTVIKKPLDNQNSFQKSFFVCTQKVNKNTLDFQFFNFIVYMI